MTGLEITRLNNYLSEHQLIWHGVAVWYTYPALRALGIILDGMED